MTADSGEASRRLTVETKISFQAVLSHLESGSSTEEEHGEAANGADGGGTGDLNRGGGLGTGSGAVAGASGGAGTGGVAGRAHGLGGRGGGGLGLSSRRGGAGGRSAGLRSGGGRGRGRGRGASRGAATGGNLLAELLGGGEDLACEGSMVSEVANGTTRGTIKTYR